MFSYLKHFKIKQPTGKKYDYSNFGAGLLGILLERIYHKSYQDLISKYIIEPSKLTETDFIVSNATKIAQGYNEQHQPVAPWNFLAMQGAGALKSSAFDLLTYSKLQLVDLNKSLNAAIKLTHRVTFDDGTNVVGTGGYRSMICVDAEKQLTVVVLTNNATTGDSLGIELIEALKTIKD